MSAIPLDASHPPRIRLKAGDVLMVHMIVSPKDGSKPYLWKWLGTVVKPLGTRGAKMIRFGAEGKKSEIAVVFGSLNDDGEGVWFIPEDEWPDGVHAFRTRLILEGKLDDAVFGT